MKEVHSEEFLAGLVVGLEAMKQRADRAEAAGESEKRRKPCDSKCPCICHDGYGGAHPGQDCRDTTDDGFGANPKAHT